MRTQQPKCSTCVRPGSERSAWNRICAPLPQTHRPCCTPVDSPCLDVDQRSREDRWVRDPEGKPFHTYRRKWVTERKHLPDVDVAAAGGWKDTQSLKSGYQQADTETMLCVVLEVGELREIR